jgi:hypothetical protein
MTTDDVSNLIFATTRATGATATEERLPEEHQTAGHQPEEAHPAPVETGDERDALIASLRRELLAALSRPVGGDAGETSAAATRLLELAVSSADELVADATAQAESLVAAGHAEAEEIRTESERRREQQVAELEEHRHTVLSEVGEQRAALQAQVDELRERESEHRTSLRRQLQAQLALLDEDEPAPLRAVSGE